MAKVSLSVEVKPESVLGKISEIQTHLTAINDILFSLRFNTEVVEVKETAPTTEADEAAETISD